MCLALTRNTCVLVIFSKSALEVALHALVPQEKLELYLQLKVVDRVSIKNNGFLFPVFYVRVKKPVFHHSEQHTWNQVWIFQLKFYAACLVTEKAEGTVFISLLASLGHWWSLWGQDQNCALAVFTLWSYLSRMVLWGPHFLLKADSTSW